MCARGEAKPAPAVLLPEALLDPLAFPDRPDRVELRETHISWVFLAGERAYKVKKPVVLAFLDYGTLARRHAFCTEEVRLNRRLAQRIYVGVVALVPRGVRGLAVGPESDPRAVEYAVEMRRYDERATLAARLAAGRATASDVAGVGAALARFHASAPRRSATAGTDWLEPVVEETLASLAGAGAGVLETPAVAACGRFARAALAGLAPELRARERAGLVRDGHGDLRAEHVLLEHHPEMVDGVEFDPALRITDVGYDFAYLVMDVSRRDEGLARALLGGYIGADGDPGSPRLLAFLIAVRALVRAKVDLLRAAQLDGVERREREQRALGLVALAERFAWRTRLPQVVCIGGLAASGKSTLAASLSAKVGWPVISSDVVRKARAGLSPRERAADTHYAPAVSRAVYAELGRAAAAAVRRDGGALVDATFRHADEVGAFLAATDAAAHAAWIVCRAPGEVLLERARRRSALGGSTSDADREVVAAQIARDTGSLPLPVAPLAVLDTVRPIERVLDELAAILDAALADGRVP